MTAWRHFCVSSYDDLASPLRNFERTISASLQYVAPSFLVTVGGGEMANERLSERFTNFVAALFEAEGFNVTKNPKAPGHSEAADLLLESSNAIRAIVEVKLHRSKIFPISSLIESYEYLSYLKRVFDSSKAIFIVNSKISGDSRSALREKFPGIIVYDSDVLLFLAAKNSALLMEYEAISREALALSEPDENSPVEADIQGDLARPSERAKQPPLPPNANPSRRNGRNLCGELRKIPPSQANARNFEKKMEEALKYIFARDLTSWVRQKRTDTGISVYDLVARVHSQHDFWRLISQHFQSKYIIFEFKNYRGKIKQGQIYTTEKYLFRSALRTTAIIISKNGADKGALSASRGALRESGKLIINISIDEVCQMLALRDQNEDHNSVLLDHVDNLLMSLER